jgi:hypothetical protein
MWCKYCKEEIIIDPNWGRMAPAYIGGARYSFCEEAPRGHNPLGKGLGNWHYPDGGEYAVSKVLNKYLPNDL